MKTYHLPIVAGGKNLLPTYAAFMSRMTEHCLQQNPGGHGDEAFAALLLLFISVLAEDMNNEGVSRVTEEFAQFPWPDAAGVRRKFNKLLDDMGFVDDTHMFN